jgi:thiamine-phosphate pyrophosphorylase
MVIVISNPTPIDHEHRIINALFDEGLSIFHLRKTTYSVKELDQLLVKIDRQHHGKVAFHQHHELAERFGSKRLHFTEQDRKKHMQSVKSMDWNSYTLSTSVHEVDAYSALPDVFDYCFLSPIFNSISKPDYHSMITPDFKLPVKSKIKIVALGGISSSGVPDLKKYDFDGIAVLGSIWGDTTKAIANFKKLQKEWGS